MNKLTLKLGLNCGFTLIETLVVIVSLILIMVSGSSLFFSSVISSTKVAALREVRQNGQYALKTMEELIKNSQGLVDCNNGTFTLSNPPVPPNVPPNITVKDASNNQISFTVIKDGNFYKIASVSGGLTYFLTSNKVKVDTFEIECGDAMNPPPPGKPPIISLKFGLSQGNLTTDPKYRIAQMTFDSNFTIRIPFKESITN